MSPELYILPPLFGLPSLSGACIAALSLCTVSLGSSSVKVIESTDLSLGLPALKRGNEWIRGYTSIKLFLQRQNDIDSHLSPSQKADSVAWGSLIEDLGETLTWNSLFLSRTNYLEATRRGVSQSLPFPKGFMLPTRLRAYAIRRCAEIGMAEEQLDEDVDTPSLKDGLNDSWLTRRRTWDEKARTLHLHALASEFYSQISQILGPTGSFLYGCDKPSSLDCLIYGQLILHLLPTMPDPVLRTTLVEKFPGLAFYLHKCHEYFAERNKSVERGKEGGMIGLLAGWGTERGKRREDFIGIGALVTCIVGYAIWNAVQRR